jgi:simple sugar transport system permease protein
MMQSMEKDNLNTVKSGRALKLQDIIKKDANLTRLVVIMAGVFIIMALLRPNLFPALDSLISMAFQFPEFGILSIAMMIAMLTGGIDLSIVGVANLSSILASMIMVHYIPAGAGIGYTVFIMLLAVIAAVVTGMICGLINGFAIAGIGIPSILTTLGTMQLFTGIGIILTKGKAVYGFPSSFTVFGTGTLWIIPIPLLIFIAILVYFSILLKKTGYGMSVYMMGTNSIASRYSGIHNFKITLQTYMYSGVLASIAGMIITSRTNSANADYGSSYTLQALLVAVLAGVNPSGGFGRIAGVVVAVLTLQFLSTGFNMLHISNFFKDFIWGALLIMVMIMNYWSNRRKSTR